MPGAGGARRRVSVYGDRVSVRGEEMFWGQMVVTAVQRCEYPSCGWTVHVKWWRWSSLGHVCFTTSSNNVNVKSGHGTCHYVRTTRVPRTCLRFNLQLEEELGLENTQKGPEEHTMRWPCSDEASDTQRGREHVQVKHGQRSPREVRLSDFCLLSTYLLFKLCIVTIYYFIIGKKHNK